MKLYLVKWSEQFEPTYNIKIFASKEKANDYADYLNSDEEDFGGYYVDEIEADLDE